MMYFRDLPEELKVGGHMYNVLVGQELPRGESCAGEHVPSTRTIHVYGDHPDGNNYAASNLWYTFMHEMVHAVAEMVGGGDLDDEKVVDRVAHMVLAMAVDNDWIVFEDEEEEWEDESEVK